MNQTQKTTEKFMLKMMLWLLLLSVAEVKERGKRKRKTDELRKKLMIPKSEISKFPEYEVKSKIGNIFVNEKIMKEYSVKIYEIGCEDILFRIDVHFSEYLLAVEIDDKVHTDRDLLFEEKIQEALEKKTWLHIYYN